MTTIAWDGKTLAVDSQGTSDGARVENILKLFSVDDMAIASTGDYQDSEVIWEWFKHHEADATPPTVESNTAGIFIKDGQAYEFYDKLRLCKVEAPQASGSGWKWAMAAMDHGLNAKEAVEYASTRDIYTGGTVDVWHMRGEV